MTPSGKAVKAERGMIGPGPRPWLAGALFVGLASQAVAQTPIPPATADFTMSVAQSDQYEITAAQDAINQSHDPRIRAFAQAMIEAHTRTRESLRQAAMASGLTPPPPAMSGDQAAMLSALQSQRGADFDKAYARQQVLAHQQALAVEQSYASAGKDAHLRQAARAALPIIQHHLQMALEISDALGGS
jgi:putative membrane protein